MRYLIWLFLSITILTGCNVSLKLSENGFYLKQNTINVKNEKQSQKTEKLSRVTAIHKDSLCNIGKGNELKFEHVPDLSVKAHKIEEIPVSHPEKSYREINKEVDVNSPVDINWKILSTEEFKQNKKLNGGKANFKKSDSSGGSDALKIVGWIFIVLGVLAVLGGSIIAGLLLALVGLLFVIVGGG